MSDPAPRRRLPRFSLITFILAVNVAGVLVGANLVEYRNSSPIQDGRFESTEKGWPFIYRGSYRKIQKIMPRPTPANLIPTPLDRIRYWSTDKPIRHIWNALVCIGAVGSLAVLTELLLRRFRKAKRHDG